MGNWKEQLQERKKRKTTEALLKRKEKSRFTSEGTKVLKMNNKLTDSFLSNTKLFNAKGHSS